MNCWHILGINPTSDEREIRRAYAKKLKITRPDEDAEAYQALRNAFDEALSIAPYESEREEPDLSSKHSADATLSMTENTQIFNRTLPTILAEIEQFYQQQGIKQTVEKWAGWEAEFDNLVDTQTTEVLSALLTLFRKNEIESPTLWALLNDKFNFRDDDQSSALLSENELSTLNERLFVASLKYDLANLNQLFKFLLCQTDSAAHVSHFWFLFQYELPLLSYVDRKYLRHHIAAILRHSRHKISETLADHWCEIFQLRNSNLSNMEGDIEIRTPNQLIKIFERLYKQGGGKAVLIGWKRLKPYVLNFDQESQSSVYHYFKYAYQHYKLPDLLTNEWQKLYDNYQDVIIENSLQNPTQQKLTIDAVLNQLERIFVQENSRGLTQHWQKITQLLTALPLEDSDEISWHCYRFLKDNLIEHPVVWANFSHYFGWHNDYRFAHYFDPEDIEKLNDKLLFAKTLTWNEQSEYPITQAIIPYLNRSLWKRCVTFIYMLLIYPFICYELSEEKQRVIAKAEPNFGDIFNVGMLRMFGGIMLWILCIFSLSSDHSDLGYIILGVIIGLLFSIYFLGGFIFKIKNFLLPKNLTKNIYYQIAFAFILPTIILFINDSTREQDIKTFPIIYLLIWFWLTLTEEYNKEWIAYNLSTFGVILMMPYLLKQSIEISHIFIMIILWINANLFIKQHFPEIWIKINQYIRQAFMEVPYDKELFLYPIKLVCANILWLFFIPNLAAHFMGRTKSYWLLAEFALGGLLILLFFGYSKFNLLFFYPAVLSAYIIQLIIKELVMLTLTR